MQAMPSFPPTSGVIENQFSASGRDPYVLK